MGWKVLMLACGWVTFLNAQVFNYGEALQKAVYFYEAQQAGPLPAWNRVEWRGPSCLRDGRDQNVDLTGGWFDAGDHVKFNFPMAWSVTTLAWGALEFEQGFFQAGQLDAIRRNIRFATDYLLKCHTGSNELFGQVGNGGADHAFWGPAESLDYMMLRPSYKISAQNPGSDLAGETAAALAAASMVFRTSDAAYADTLLRHARTLYDFADRYRGKYSVAISDAQGYYNSWSGYNDELVWGALWLHKATGEASFLARARAGYDSLNTEPQSTTKSFKWTFAWDDKSYASYVLMAQLTDSTKYHQDAQRWLDYWSVGTNGERIGYTPGGLAWLDQWGALRYAANTSLVALIYAKSLPAGAVKTRYHDFAVRQINYMLGDNPGRRSFVVGFGNNPPRQPHHRTSHGIYPSQASDTTPSRHILYGALVGGPDRSDAYQDSRNNYVTNEVACDYNAGFVGALAALRMESGGTPLANFPMPESRQPEFFVEASVNVSGNGFTEIRAMLQNRSAWPARGSDSLSYRYYLNISEAVAAGLTAADLIVTRNYAQGRATVSNLRPFDAANHLYYVQVDYTGDTLYPGTQDSYRRECQFRIAVPQSAPSTAWNQANDWSYLTLKAGGVALTTGDPSANITVYWAGTRVYGLEPGSTGVFMRPWRPDGRLPDLIYDASGRRLRLERRAAFPIFR